MAIKATDGRLTNKSGMVGSISDDVFRDVRIDTSSRALETIAYPHHEIHGGSAYHCSDVQNVSTTTLKWMVTTPNTTKYAHMLFSVGCTGEMYVIITEGADRTGTNLLGATNHDRNSANTAGLVLHRAYSSGSTDGATTIYANRTGATGVGSKTVSTGSSSHGEEFILKKNTKYIVSVETFANVYVSTEFDWYEHTAKS